VWLRGTLITLASVLVFLNNDETFRHLVSPVTLTVIGAITVAVIQIRGFIDKSASGQTPAVPVEVTASEPLPVTVEEESSEDVPVSPTPVSPFKSSPSPLSKVALRAPASGTPGGSS